MTSAMQRAGERLLNVITVGFVILEENVNLIHATVGLYYADRP